MTLAPLAIALFLSAGDDEPPKEESAAGGAWIEGHSMHGEVFNAGPRQEAYLMGRGVDTPFAVTTDVPLAQVFFNQGICQLHGFWYLEAERTFRQVAKLDPDCAMAYWGMCQANLVYDEERAAGFAREAFLRRDHATDREQRYIDMMARFFAVNYDAFDPAKHMPKKDESKADEPKKDDAPLDGDNAGEFSASTTSNEDETSEQDTETQPTADDLEQARLAYEKDKRAASKPGDDKQRRQRLVKDFEALIYDYPCDVEAKAFLVNQLWLNTRRGLQITSKMANQALIDQVLATEPMHPIHHYRIHLWDTKDEAYRVLDSAARSGQSAPGIAHMWHMGGHIFAQVHRHAEAAWQQEASARVDHAYMMENGLLPDQIGNFAHNNEWLCRSLMHVGRVRDAIDLARNMIELPRHPKYNELSRRGSSRYGRMRLLGALEGYELWDELIRTCDTMYLASGGVPEDEALRAFALGKAYVGTGDLDSAGTSIETLNTLLADARTRRADAMAEAEDAAFAEKKKDSEIEDAVDLIAEEHAGKVRDIQRKVASLTALRALQDEQSDEERRKELLKELEDAKYDQGALALLHLDAGEHKRAVELARKATENKPNQALAHANLAYVLHATGDADGAKETFESIRVHSAHFDLDVPVFERLGSLAESLGYPSDWRVEEQLPDDIGERPTLASLGPFRWSPTAASGWALPNAEGKTVSLADYRGRPVLVVFFLGFGCVHCVEQLDALRPVVDQFREQGIELVTIGTDTLEQVRFSRGEDPAKWDAFEILADPELTVFKQWRCHDDFEEMPLHGTFLVDGDGLVRWNDISYEPFMDTDFLLAESKRLLGLPSPLQLTGETTTTEAPAATATGAGSD